MCFPTPAHFSITGPNLANEVSPVTDDSSHANYIVGSDNRFCFSPPNGSNVRSLLNNLPTSKATGLDNLASICQID